MCTADKSDVEIITPLLLSERKSLGPVAELGRSYKGTLLSLTLFLTARWNCRWRPERVVLGWFQVHVDLHIVSTYRDFSGEVARVDRIWNPKACNALLIYPRFDANTFWNFKRTAEVFGAKYPASPLGLITVAALLPHSWSIRLVNRNTEELSDADLDWADLVFTGGMLPQQSDTLDVVDFSHVHGKPVVVGGPGVTSCPHLYQAADFRVIGEAEHIIGNFIEAWDAGAREGQFEAEKFQTDVTRSPIPRFDLLKFEDYLHIGVQFSRCPFTCEFCDIIELYGRVPRAKTNAQMLAELDELYRLGYRGHVDFVDDNLIGNKKAVKAFLPELAKWLEARDYPFEFTTEASINLADDSELLELMECANFVGVFCRHRKPRHRDADRNAQEAEYAAQHCAEHSEDLRIRSFCDRGLHHRLRQRNGV